MSKNKLYSRQHLRLEEYASSGLVLQSEGVKNSSVAVQASSMRANKSRHEDDGSAHLASTSHCLNDRYMEAFDTAFETIRVAKRVYTDEKHSYIGKEPSTTTLPKSKSAIVTQPKALKALKLTGAWIEGPSNQEGELLSVSAQPLLCMSMNAEENEIVVGSSDHALYALPVANSPPSLRKASSSTRPRTLYTKTYGHVDWVTCVAHLPDGRLVSGGMDSKLCLWDAKGVKCEHLLGHSGSVSRVLCLSNEMVLSAGYDKMIRVWNARKRCSSRQREVNAIKAGSAPLLDVSLLGGGQHVVCGDRGGDVQVVDWQANKVLQRHANAHQGHTTSVLGCQSHDPGSRSFFSGGQDGVVKGWDLRQQEATVSLERLHVDADRCKTGAVGFLCEPEEDGNILVTGGADGVINVLDKRHSYHVVHRFTEHVDFIYSLHLRSQLCFSGAGNGMLHVHDWKQGKLLYGLGANQAAVRAIAASGTHLIAAGDDGSVMMYDMK